MPGRVLTALAVAGALVAVAFVARGEKAAPPAASPVSTIALAGVLEDMHGAKIDLASYGGKPLIINMWATWCGPCKLETPQLVALSEKFKARGLAIIGISVDDQPDAIRAFAAEYKVPYPMLVGVGRDDLLQKLGYQDELPFSLLLRPDGRIAGAITGIETTADWEKRIEDLLK